ncbi:hypothetical protein C8J28_12014 [Cereibacter azotoformans]|uniref:Uncharacterized protein n=1 Tax=Cereibacter azotoformans TaxID=43057 RepID=A0A2T5JUE6_9RHOB|nr:hypothetical protein C8J28_12014 [Cereibacter azotoformans]
MNMRWLKSSQLCMMLPGSWGGVRISRRNTGLRARWLRRMRPCRRWRRDGLGMKGLRPLMARVGGLRRKPLGWRSMPRVPQPATEGALPQRWPDPLNIIRFRAGRKRQRFPAYGRTRRCRTGASIRTSIVPHRNRRPSGCSCLRTGRMRARLQLAQRPSPTSCPKRSGCRDLHRRDLPLEPSPGPPPSPRAVRRLRLICPCPVPPLPRPERTPSRSCCSLTTSGRSG